MLATLILITSLLAIWLVLLPLWPWVALVTSFAFPALVRTVVVGRHRQLSGERLGTGQYLELFVVSLYAVGLMLLATAAAFAAATMLMSAATATFSSASEAARGDWAFVVGTLVSLP